MVQRSKDKPYYDLQKLYGRHPMGAPESQTFVEILKCYFDPDEARLAAAMSFDPEPEDLVAGRTIDVGHLEQFEGGELRCYKEGSDVYVRRPEEPPGKDAREDDDWVVWDDSFLESSRDES